MGLKTDYNQKWITVGLAKKWITVGLVEKWIKVTLARKSIKVGPPKKLIAVFCPKRPGRRHTAGNKKARHAGAWRALELFG